ncbi:MAG: alanine racemase, partial [Bartonella sp.]|nr:alanine racemase [Bartonella sp.]
MDKFVGYEANATLPYTAIATIDIGAIVANYKTLVQRVAPIECSAVVKADAYGLGAEKIAPALYQAGCRTFFIAHLKEALQLKAILPNNVTLILLNGIPPKAEEFVTQTGIVPVLNSRNEIENWQMHCQKNG